MSQIKLKGKVKNKKFLGKLEQFLKINKSTKQEIGKDVVRQIEKKGASKREVDPAELWRQFNGGQRANRKRNFEWTKQRMIVKGNKPPIRQSKNNKESFDENLKVYLRQNQDTLRTRDLNQIRSFKNKEVFVDKRKRKKFKYNLKRLKEIFIQQKKRIFG